MPERTINAEKLDTETAADRLEAVASALREGENVRVRVGNKSIGLAPPETVNYRIEVVERSSMWRGSREKIQVELGWKPK